MAQEIAIPLVDLRAQYTALKPEIDGTVARVLDSGWYILGQEVTAFEEEFARFCGVRGCVGVNSGTDALHLALRACDVGAGDEVITVSHTAVATVAAIGQTGAMPVLVDVEPATYTLDPSALQAALTPQTKVIIPVHIYGHPAEMDSIMEIARGVGVRVIEDCAQAHGAYYRGQSVGAIGDLGCFSFYPTKNLGALGDGGAVVGNDADLIARVRRGREYGWTPAERYVSQTPGVNSRLDEMQAAILRVKLRHLDEWNGARRALAARYAETLPPQVTQPVALPDCQHVYHLYVIRTQARDRLRAALTIAGIGTGIHYPVPVHRQPAYQRSEVRGQDLPRTERFADEILSLPMHPLMSLEQIEMVSTAISRFS